MGPKVLGSWTDRAAGLDRGVPSDKMTGDEDRTSRLDARDGAHNEPRLVDCSARQAAVGTDVASIDLTLIEKCFTVE